jgi:hypothetical protein
MSEAEPRSLPVGLFYLPGLPSQHSRHEPGEVNAGRSDGRVDNITPAESQLFI